MSRPKNDRLEYPLTELEIDDFYTLISHSGRPGCHEFSRRFSQGYGRFHLRGKPCKAHRISWMIHYGDIPDGKMVLHSCDNRACVNPKHLFLGSHLDNMADMISKGRHFGKSRNTKISEDDVFAIRFMYENTPLNQREIGEMFGVSRNQINNILCGIRWAHFDRRGV